MQPCSQNEFKFVLLSQAAWEGNWGVKCVHHARSLAEAQNGSGGWKGCKGRAGGKDSKDEPLGFRERVHPHGKAARLLEKREWESSSFG